LQGARAAQKRERNAGKVDKGGKSQAKVNEAARSIVCAICKQPFVSKRLLSSLALVHSHNILSVNDHSGACVSFLLEDPGWCGLLEILFDSCTALTSTHRTNIRRLWRNASRLMRSEPKYLDSRWAYGINGIKGLLNIHTISRNVFSVSSSQVNLVMKRFEGI
jgi:hypothetical protein